ncbi:MAG: F0F1 ATP synthase subunit gamma [Magnetococcales bacterium]|nr:F0F1 ATP synthase subunit gamma [Magnetococcales bacterium]
MANLKHLRNRIRSVNNTRQITKAMKMVSAAKLRRSQERALATRPYSLRIRAMIQRLATLIPADNALPLLSRPPEGARKIHLVIYTADRGLCGSFNSSIIRATRARIAQLTQQGHTVSLTFVGRKAHDVLKRQFGALTRDVHVGLTRNLTFESAERIVAAKLLADFETGQFDECHLVYNAFKSAMTQELTWRQLIPAPVENSAGADDEEVLSSPLFEPDEETVLAALLPRNIAVQIFQALAESNAAEHAARMTAMDNAVRNAGEMLKKLNIKYNRTRQAAITTELMEIIGGSESLKG